MTEPKWQEIWQTEGPVRLWTVPDLQVVKLVEDWKAAGDIRRVFDIGCGLGRHAHLLASEGFEVYGSDHSSAAIEKCNEWLSGEGLRGEFWCGELDEIPYPDGHFDAVVAFNSIYHSTAESLARVTRLLHDKLRPGGKCFVTLPSRQNRMYGKGEPVGPHTFLSPGMFTGLFEHDGENGVPHHYCSEEEILQFFDGFDVISLTHEELQLASAGQDGGEVKWLRIPRAFFWRLNATRQ